MSRRDREKWDRRYAEESYRKHNPVSLLHEWLPRLRIGKALDIACGAGRNAIFLAEAGFGVDAIDISPVGLETGRLEALRKGVTVNWIEHDLDEPYDFDRDYDLIVMLWFVRLDLLGQLCSCLAPGGYLVSEQHLLVEGDSAGPSNPRFRVAPGDLRMAVSSLEVLLYEEGESSNTAGEPMASARVVARRP